MNWIEKILSRKNTTSEKSENIDIMEDLFIDNTQPAVQEKVHTEVIKKANNGVMSFLDQDFYSKGFDDGYKNHSNEIMNNVIHGIKADFRIKIDILMDQKRNRKLEILNMQTETGKISENLNSQVVNIMKDLEQSLSILNKEKGNSAIDEGWVMKAIHKYRDGFVKGTGRYQEEKLLAISTGMFN